MFRGCVTVFLEWVDWECNYRMNCRYLLWWTSRDCSNQRVLAPARARAPVLAPDYCDVNDFHVNALLAPLWNDVTQRWRVVLKSYAGSPPHYRNSTPLRGYPSRPILTYNDCVERAFKGCVCEG